MRVMVTIISRWTEYCSEPYRYECNGDNTILECSQQPEEDLLQILREKIDITVAALTRRKSAESRPCSSRRGEQDRCFDKDL